MLRFFVCVSLSVLLSWTFSIEVLRGLSLSPQNNLGSDKDFEMSDVYIRILDRKSFRKLSEVTVVAIDELNRENVGDLIEKISTFSSPKAIGLDIRFDESKENDTTLIWQLMTCDNMNHLVLACMLDNQVENGFETIDYSYFQEYIHFNTGVINLDASTRYETIRNFKIEFSVCNQKVNSLSMEMIRLTNNSLYLQLKKYGGDPLLIYYPANYVEVVSGADILSNKIDVSCLDDQYVLLGDVNLMSDSYMTPLGSISGVEIHAYALNTLLEHRIIKKLPNYVIWIIAVVLCVIFSSVDLLLKQSVGSVGFFLKRIFQGFVILGLIGLGVRLLDHSGIYLNISLPLTMIAMGLLSNDIIYGFYDLYKITMNVIIKHKKL